GRERNAMKMLSHITIAIDAKPMRNMTPMAHHCVVSTERKSSCVNHSTSAYRYENARNPTTITARMATTIAIVLRPRLRGFDVEVADVTGCAPAGQRGRGPRRLASILGAPRWGGSGSAPQLQLGNASIDA